MHDEVPPPVLTTLLFRRTVSSGEDAWKRDFAKALSRDLFR
jgi:hypothetical protein